MGHVEYDKVGVATEVNICLRAELSDRDRRRAGDRGCAAIFGSSRRTASSDDEALGERRAGGEPIQA